MHCPDCDLSLWHVANRTCPGCGRPFKPSAFEFVPESVAFCCPHCDQHYYGTTDKGHLEPPTFDCAQCGRRIDMDEMVLRPAEGVDERDTSADVNPWIERKKRGRFKAYFTTIWQGLSRPGRLAAAVPPKNSPLAGLGYMLVNFLLFPLTCFLGLLAVPAARDAMSHNGGVPRALTGIALVAVGIMVLLTVGTLIWAVVSQWVLILLWTKPRGEWSRTLDSLCYTSGANILTAMPWIGLHLWIFTFPIWWISATIAVKHVHRTPPIRTAIAVGLVPLLTFGGVIGLTAQRIISHRQDLSSHQANYTESASPTSVTQTVPHLAFLRHDTDSRHALSMNAD